MTSSHLTRQAQAFCTRWQSRFLCAEAIAALRDTELLSHMARPGLTAHEIHDAAFDLLLAMGAIDLPAAVGLTMHQYTLCTIATAAIEDAEARAKRDRFLAAVRDSRLLCAVSSFDMTIGDDGTIRAGLNASRRDGHWIVNGHKRYQSMASVADLLFFTAAISERSFGLFYVSLKDNPQIAIGATPATAFLRATDTRSIDFRDVSIPEHQLVSVTDLGTTTQFHGYSLSWFQALIPAAYLGAARAAIARLARGAAPRHEVDLGRLDLQLQSALMLRHGPRAALHELATRPAAALEEFAAGAALFKYAATRAAEDIVATVRRLGGLGLMVDGGAFATLSDYVVYGPLHPRPNADLEAAAGRAALAAT